MKIPAQNLFRAALATIVLSCGSAAAAPLYWDTNGATAGTATTSTSVWGLDSVWSASAAGDAPTTAWTAGSDAYFSAGPNFAGAYTVYVNGAQSANGLVLEDGTITLHAGTAGGVLSAGAGNLTIGAGGISMVDGLGGTATIGASLGTLTLSSSQTWSNTTANATSARNFAVAAGIQGGAGDTTLTVTGNNFVVNATTTNTGTTNLSGIIANGSSGALSITKTGSNTLTLSGTGSNTYTGLTTLSGGTLNLSKTSSAIAIAGNIAVNGGTLAWGGNNQVAETASVTISGGTANTGAYTQTISSLSLSNGGQRFTVNSGAKFTTNSLTLTGGANNIGGATGGNILIGGNAAALTTLTVGAGGLSMSGQNIQFNQINTGGVGSQIILNGDFTASGNNLITYGTTAGTHATLPLASSVNLGGVDRRFTISSGTTTIGVGLTNGSLRKSGTGTLLLSGAGNYTGVTNVEAGIVRVGHDAALGTDAQGTIVEAGAAVYLQGNVNVANEALTIKAVALGGQSAGLLNASGNNTWGGDITLDLTGSENNTRINMTGGTLLISGDIAINSNPTSTVSGLGLVLTGDAGTGTISGNISGTGASQHLIKNGTSTWVLSGNNTYSGTTRVDVGTLSVSDIAANLGTSTTAISLGESNTVGTLQYTGATTTITRGFDMRSGGAGGGVENAGTGVVTVQGPVTGLTSSSINKNFILSGTGNGIVTGQINEAVGSATMGVLKAGTGTWTLAGTNSYQGATAVTGGTLNVSTSIITSSSLSATGGAIVMGGTDFIADNAGIGLGEGGILRMAGFSDIVGALTTTGNGILDLAMGSSIITFADSSSTFGSGTLTILGWNGSTSGGGTEQVNFLATGGVETYATHLASIFFENPEGFAPGTYSAKFIGNELVPDALIPEPSAIITSILGATALLSRRRRRD